VIVIVPKSGWPVFGQTEVNSVPIGVLVVERFEDIAKALVHRPAPLLRPIIVA